MVPMAHQVCLTVSSAAVEVTSLPDGDYLCFGYPVCVGLLGDLVIPSSVHASSCTSCASGVAISVRYQGLLKLVIVMGVQDVSLMLSDMLSLHAVSSFFPLWENVCLDCILIYKPRV